MVRESLDELPVRLIAAVVARARMAGNPKASQALDTKDLRALRAMRDLLERRKRYHDDGAIYPRPPGIELSAPDRW